MKKIAFLLFMVTVCLSSFAQAPVQYGPVKKGDSQAYSDIREKLVTLAMQNPQMEISDAQIQIADNNLQRAKTSWLSTITAQGNINEFTLNGSPSAAFWPKYNFGVMLPMDIFTRTSNEIKNARENITITKAAKNDNYRRIRTEVLSHFEEYLYYREVLDMQTVLTDDAYANYLSMQQKYKIGDVNDVDYAMTFRLYNEAKIKQRETERDMNIAKLNVEKMIGVSLDDVLKNYKLTH